jgi:LDH2 family malate/lactate/ureidoglycolate dehydrogenase
VDILCGLLTGSSLTGSVKNVTDMSGPALTGHMFIVIDIAHFIEPEAFTKSMEAVIGAIRGMKPKSGNKVYMAGEIEFDLEEKKRATGLELDEDVVKSLNSLAARYGLAAL